MRLFTATFAALLVVFPAAVVKGQFTAVDILDAGVIGTAASLTWSSSSLESLATSTSLLEGASPATQQTGTIPKTTGRRGSASAIPTV